MSLIKKLTEKTKKRIVATVLAGGIALSGLGMTGCTSCNPDPNNTNPPITNPGGDNGGTQAPGNNNGGNSGSQTPDYSKYSQILQNVLTDDYYTSIASIENSDTDYGKKRWSYNHPKALSIPYGFLEDEGLDIESIKSKYLPVKSCIYLIENDLYIEVLAGIKSTTKFITDENIYYANYLLKYNLTNQELKEIKTLFTPLGIDFKTT